MSDETDWFAPKRYGLGASWPISWQGWAVTIAYVLSIGLGSLLIRYSLVGYASVVIIATATFIVISSRTTRGGWRWRWGEED
jgi:hypothetical protein